MFTDSYVCLGRPKNELIRTYIRIGRILDCLFPIISILLTFWLIFCSGNHLVLTWGSLLALLGFCFFLFFVNSFFYLTTRILEEYPCYLDEMELERQFPRLLCTSFLSFWVVLLPGLLLGSGIFEDEGCLLFILNFFFGLVCCWGLPGLMFWGLDLLGVVCISQYIQNEPSTVNTNEILSSEVTITKPSEPIETPKPVIQTEEEMSDPLDDIENINEHLFEDLDAILQENNRTDYFDKPDKELYDSNYLSEEPTLECQPDECQPDECQPDECQPDECQPNECQPDECQPDECLLHQQNRILGANGEERIEGRLQVQLQEKEGHRTVYIGFCPPFRSIPMFYFEATTENDCQTNTTQIQPFGVRLEIKRKNSGTSENIQYVYYAGPEE